VSFLRNLGAGNYTPVDRVRKIVGNVLIKVRKRQACCGHYGDPGC
jgi:hypothetical protein